MKTQTISKLNEMRLTAMAESYSDQKENRDYDDMSFDDRFAMIVDIEWARRKSNKLNRLIRKATFRYPNAKIEDIEYHVDRKLNKDQLTRLSSCLYVKELRNIIIMGASGNGKSYIACALGNAACRNFHTVKYIRLPELLDELAVARGEGIFKKVIKQYKKVNLLILDEWMLTPLKETEARDLFEIIEARHEQSSTIFCSQYAPEGWYDNINQETLADAILDRIIHNSHKIFIDGHKSMRERFKIQE